MDVFELRKEQIYQLLPRQIIVDWLSLAMENKRLVRTIRLNHFFPRCQRLRGYHVRVLILRSTDATFIDACSFYVL